MTRIKPDEPEDEEEQQDPSAQRVGAAPRLSLTLPATARRKIRLAAAIADMSEPEWARIVLVQAAARVVKKHGF